MEITSLGNCPATLLVDPMAVDGDSFRAYLDATQRAGFDAVSLWAFHLAFAGPGSADAVRASGLDVKGVEAAIGWSDGPSDAALAEVDGLIQTGLDLGAHIVGAACLGPADDRSAATAGLAAIAERAADADMVIALEFLPWTGIPTFAAANEIVIATGQDNATILVDTFHWTRQPGGPDFDTLRSVPGSRVAYVQMCDPAPDPGTDVETEAMHGRVAPGVGAVDYPALWDALDAVGAEPFVAAEVFSDELSALGPHAMAEVVHDASRAQLP